MAVHVKTNCRRKQFGEFAIQPDFIWFIVRKFALLTFFVLGRISRVFRRFEWVAELSYMLNLRFQYVRRFFILCLLLRRIWSCRLREESAHYLTVKDCSSLYIRAFYHYFELYSESCKEIGWIFSVLLKLNGAIALTVGFGGVVGYARHP